MNSKAFQDIFKHLRAFCKCPSCGESYHLGDIRFLGKVENYYLVQLSCHECALPMLATVFLDVEVPAKGSRKKAGAKSDLKPRERARFAQKGEISADEIAGFHRFLLDHRSDLHHLSS